MRNNLRDIWKTNKFFYIILIFFVLTVPALAASGEELYASGDYSGALELFKQDLENTQGAGQAQVLNNIGTCYTALGELDNAAEYFQKAITTDPEYWRGYINLGVVQERQGKGNDALSSYGKVKNSNPLMYAEAQVKKGTLLAAQGKNDEALSAFKQGESGAAGAVKVDLYTGIGAVEFLNKNNDAAEKAFVIATETDPNDAALAWTNLGVLHISQGKYDEAKKDFETAIKHDTFGQTKASEYLQKLQKIQGN